MVESGIDPDRYSSLSMVVAMVAAAALGAGIGWGGASLEDMREDAFARDSAYVAGYMSGLRGGMAARVRADLKMCDARYISYPKLSETREAWSPREVDQ